MLEELTKSFKAILFVTILNNLYFGDGGFGEGG